jgi:hypothetical protein
VIGAAVGLPPHVGGDEAQVGDAVPVGRERRIGERFQHRA